MPMQLPDMNKRKILSHAKSVGNKRKLTEDRIFSYPILCSLCHLNQRKKIRTKFMQLRIYFNVVCKMHTVGKKGFYKTLTFDCSSPQYSGEMVCQTVHCLNKKSYQGIET